jgi:hypothetical protein
MRDAVAASYGKPADPAAADANVAGMTLKAEHRARLRALGHGLRSPRRAQAMYEDLTTDMRPELAQIRAPVTVVHAWNQNYPRKDPATAFFGRQYAAGRGQDHRSRRVGAFRDAGSAGGLPGGGDRVPALATPLSRLGRSINEFGTNRA